MCRSKPVGPTRGKGSTLYRAIDDAYLFETRTAKHKKKAEVFVVFHDEFGHVVHRVFNIIQ